VKAAFIYNFAKFVRWPNESNAGSITLYILGDDPFGDDINTIQGELIRGKSLEIKRINSPRDIKSGNILFIASSEKRNIEHIVASVKGLSILTIGDTKNFLKKGAMINFIIKNDMVRFKINKDAAEREGLKISSKLLKLAKT
jgi:hypothetical protein